MSSRTLLSLRQRQQGTRRADPQLVTDRPYDLRLRSAAHAQRIRREREREARLRQGWD